MKDEKKLEELLEQLFSDDDEIEVLRGPRPPRPYIACCTYNYAAYGG